MSSEAKYKFVWKIEHFSMLLQMNGNYLTSGWFSTENIGDSIWCMDLYPKGINKESEGYASLFLKRSDKDIRTAVNDINVKLEIVGPDGRVVDSVKNENVSVARGFELAAKFFKIDEVCREMEKWKEDTLTIRCTLINRKKLMYETRTKIFVDHCIFKWNVELQDGLVPIPLIQREFCLRDNLQFHINLAAPENEIKVFVKRRDNDNFSNLSCRISLLDVNGVEVRSKRLCTEFEEPASDNIWEFSQFLSVEDLKFMRNDVLKNGIFTLLFEFSLAKERNLVNVDNSMCNSSSEQCNIMCLRENLKEMYRYKLYPDIQLQVGGKLLHAHKAVLAARCPFFKVMFSHDMQESQTGLIDIPDLDAEIFEFFLEFLYTAEVEKMDYEIANKLIIIADKYGNNGLKVKCCQVLRSHLSSSNVCEVLDLSDMVNYDELKEYAIDFVALHAREILTSSEWRKWSENNFKLASEIISRLAINF